MLVPRRVRRRLLLPPGLVALGFLLLLGCQALQPWSGRVKQWNVMQMTIPAFHVDKSASWNTEVYQSPKQLNSFRPWHDVAFEGNKLADFLNAATTESAVRQIIADTNHAGGVRIRFLPGATYANLVKVLDIMNYTNQKKYWLDIHYEPITLYEITTLPTPKYPMFVCGTGYHLYHTLPKQPDFWQRLGGFCESLIKQAGRAWVPTALLWVVMGFLNVKQLFRAKLSRYNLES